MSNSTIASLALIAAAAVLSPILADRLKRWLLLPTVVLELALGVLIGPDVLGWASEDAFIGGLADVGLAILMFLAGYEIDFAVVRGQPLTLAVKGWFVSLAIGFAVAGVFAFSQGDLRLHEVALGLAFTTTALGTLLPILRDTGITKTPFGAYVLARRGKRGVPAHRRGLVAARQQRARCHDLAVRSLPAGRRRRRATRHASGQAKLHADSR